MQRPDKPVRVTAKGWPVQDVLVDQHIPRRDWAVRLRLDRRILCRLRLLAGWPPPFQPHMPNTPLARQVPAAAISILDLIFAPPHTPLAEPWTAQRPSMTSSRSAGYTTFCAQPCQTRDTKASPILPGPSLVSTAYQPLSTLCLKPLPKASRRGTSNPPSR